MTKWKNDRFNQEKTRAPVKKAGFSSVTTGKVVPINGFELLTYRLQGGREIF